MKSKQDLNRPFLLSVTLIVLSILAVTFVGGLIYIGIFYAEAERGLEVYLADTFAKFPFVVIYSFLVIFAVLLLVSVILMWQRKTLGLFLYFSWSFALVLLLLFGQQFDWFNALILIVLVLILSLNFSYFPNKHLEKTKEEKENYQ